MACAQGDQYSYAEVAVGKKRVKISYKTETGETVSDVDGSECGPYKLSR